MAKASSTETSKEATIVNELGLHARSASQVARLAAKARSSVWLCKGDRKADATSIMDVLTLECPKGTKLVVLVEDPDDTEILQQIVTLIESGFGE
jgi:phosphocarrier protein HPr